jgi:hypothetical protein
MNLTLIGAPPHSQRGQGPDSFGKNRKSIHHHKTGALPNLKSKEISSIAVNGSSENSWPNASPIVFFAKASRGEERTFALLKKLPDDYLIYYEPNIDNRHPDFMGRDALFTIGGDLLLATWASPG